jgi:hypothetical protein
MSNKIVTEILMAYFMTKMNYIEIFYYGLTTKDSQLAQKNLATQNWATG